MFTRGWINFGAWFLQVLGWIGFGLLVLLLGWLSAKAYEVHWLLGFPLRLLYLVIGLGWLLAGLWLLIFLGLIVWLMIREETVRK